MHQKLSKRIQSPNPNTFFGFLKSGLIKPPTSGFCSFRLKKKMETEGHRGSSNPSAMLASLMGKREKLQEELRGIEKQVEEHMVGRDDGRSDFGLGRSKGAPANGQGKPKKGGRTAPRDGKRFRPSSEHDIDDEDDPDLTLR